MAPEEDAFAFSQEYPVAGWVSGTRDENALFDCLRVRLALHLYAGWGAGAAGASSVARRLAGQPL